MLSKAALDTPLSNPSRNRQAAQTPVSSRMAPPHFSHFEELASALTTESESPSEFFIAS
jgi:hypothetical protein